MDRCPRSEHGRCPYNQGAEVGILFFARFSGGSPSYMSAVRVAFLDNWEISIDNVGSTLL